MNPFREPNVDFEKALLVEVQKVLTPAQLRRVGSLNRIGRKPRKRLVAEAREFAENLGLGQFLDWTEGAEEGPPPHEPEGCLEPLQIIARDNRKRGDYALCTIGAILTARVHRKVSP
jgi:hypothetical protein